VTPQASEVAIKALWHAIGEVGVTEKGAPNRGPEVDEYLRAAGLEPEGHSYPWCVAFVRWCFKRASGDLGVENPCPKTASVFKLWAKCFAQRTHTPVPGAIFIIDRGDGVHGHAGLVVSVGPGRLVTCEGNTNALGHRDGNCVAVRVRQFHDIAGYIVL
jgi:hypothetical protein